MHIAIIFILSLILGREKVWAYPEFIGHGYTSCLTCHFNAAGNGPLSDYGRALFATEIASKPFWNAKASDEQLGNSSGLLGSASMPTWLRAGLKYRGIDISTNPSLSQQSSRSIPMQADLNLIFIFDQEQKLIFAATAGQYPEAPGVTRPEIADPTNNMISREYYLRWQGGENWWIYGGLMDKTYGIRIVDHTAYSRTRLGLDQTSQAHGLVFHKTSEKYELFINPYAGHLGLPQDKQSQGAAILFEYEPYEKQRLGFSTMFNDNKTESSSALALLSKTGIGEGHSILLEAGITEKTTKPATTQQSAYGLLMATVRNKRGLYTQSIAEYYKDQLTGAGSEYLKYGVGALYFPFQRLELRLQLMQRRLFSPSAMQPDTTNIQTQVHLAL